MKTTEEIGQDYIKQRFNENRMKKEQKWYSEEEMENAKIRAYDEGHREGRRE